MQQLESIKLVTLKPERSGNARLKLRYSENVSRLVRMLKQC